MRILLIAPLTIFLIVILIMMFKIFHSHTEESSFLIGKKLPEFSLTTLNKDKPPFTNKDLSGQYALLNVFGSWCITCKIEHPFLMKLKENNIIPVYGIAWRDSLENVSKYIKENGNPYKNIGLDLKGQTIINFGVTGAPETFLISPEGIVLLRFAGQITPEIWSDKILPIIERR